LGKDKTEKFIRHWSNRRDQGKSKYIIINSIRYIIGVLVATVIISIYTGNSFDFLFFIGLSIGGIIGNILAWYSNEKKYSNLININKE
jgi:hypothetical protein